MTSADAALASLEQTLERIRRIPASETEEPGVADLSYAVWPVDIAGSWEAAISRLRVLLDSLTRFAAAETVQADAGARSVVSWTGDLATVCTPGTSAAQLRLHLEALETDVRYRSKMILITAASVQAAAFACAAIASPAGVGPAFRAVTSLVCELQSLSRQAGQE